ncbi:MAG: tRNA pseudouridine(13) synthase TruD [Methylococcales bacterium]|nr:tRNA pseudouridine(13) synthase TruD [Methylococcales bacterium]
MRIQAANLMWEFKDTQTLVLKFNLPAGSYATAVLREIIAL